MSITSKISASKTASWPLRWGLLVFGITLVLWGAWIVFLNSFAGDLGRVLRSTWQFPVVGGILASGAALCGALAGRSPTRWFSGQTIKQGSWILAALLAGAMLSGWIHVKSTDEARVGEVIGFAGPTLDGGYFDLQQERGTLLLLDFWASWCGPCIAAHPQLQSIAELYRDWDFDIIGVALDTERQTLADFLEAHSQPAWRQVYFGEGVGFDAPAVKDLEVTRLPNYFLIDGEGRLISRPRAAWQIKTLVGKALGAPVPWRDRARLFGVRRVFLLQTGLSWSPLWLLALGVGVSSVLFALGLRVFQRPPPRTAPSLAR